MLNNSYCTEQYQGDRLIDTKKVDAFFKERKNEATLGRAVLAFIGSTLLLSISVVFSNFKNNIGIIFNPQVFFSLVDTVGFYFGLLAVILFTPLLIVNWTLAKYMLKSKTRFVELVYVSMIAMMILPVAFILATVLGAIIPEFLGFVVSILFLVLIVGFLYALVVAIKTVHQLKNEEAIVNIILTQIATGPVQFGVFVVYVIIVLASPVHYEMTQVNNSDGTMTASFAYVYDSSGEPREICYVNVPRGWGS